MSGVKGQGPWDMAGDPGIATKQSDARRIPDLVAARNIVSWYWEQGHPSAKVFRLVRRSSLTTLERAVVEAAMTWSEAAAGSVAPAIAVLLERCRALRAKRGG